MADKIPLKLTTGPNEIQEFAAGDTVGTAHLPSTVVYTSGAQTLVDKTLDPTTVASRLLAVGATPARVLDLASTGTATDYDAVKLTTQTAGNGAIISPVTSGTNADLKVQALGTGNVLVRNNSTDMGVVVGTTGTQTLDNKTLTTPTISSTGFTNAQHAHLGASSGGALSAAAITSGSFSQDRIADVGNRSGSYAFGRGNSVLIDGTVAAGSGGNARWAERSRVAQVQAANYTVSTGVGTGTYATCTSLSLTCSATSGFSFNTTPDCIVDTVGGGTSLSASSLKGKTIRLTLNGTLNVASTTRNADLQFRYNAGVMSVSLQAASIPVGTFPWTAIAYVVFHGTQDNVAANMHIWIESFKVFQAGASIDGIGVVGSSFTATSITNGSVVSFDARMRLTTAAASDSLDCHNAIWEVLN